tara:strand:+ start:154 stop:399 length:246 start_codon:yes stop_codon:yes gene_type:complete
MMLKHECARLSLALTLTAIALLSGCATPSFECPIPKEYSAEVQTQAANELVALPSGSVIGDFIADYGVLRAQARACQGGRA